MIRNKWFAKFGITLIGICLLFIYGFCKAEAEEWKLFQATTTGNIYYFDSTSIKHFPNDVVWVWVRIVETTGFSEEDLKGLRDPKKAKNVLKRAHERSAGEWKQLFEIMCSTRMVRTLSATLYDKDGNIKEDYEIPSEWVYIPPNSVTNHLIKMICP
jgi:hypothetical protein